MKDVTLIHQCKTDTAERTIFLYSSIGSLIQLTYCQKFLITYCYWVVIWDHIREKFKLSLHNQRMALFNIGDFIRILYYILWVYTLKSHKVDIRSENKSPEIHSNDVSSLINSWSTMKTNYYMICNQR
jgi:hypothetical protein